MPRIPCNMSSRCVHHITEQSVAYTFQSCLKAYRYNFMMHFSLHPRNAVFLWVPWKALNVACMFWGQILLHSTGFDWQPAVSKRGRNITRATRHKYMDDIDISSDEDWPSNPASKRPRRMTRQHSTAEPRNGFFCNSKPELNLVGRPAYSKPPSQVNRQSHSRVATDTCGFK